MASNSQTKSAVAASNCRLQAPLALTGARRDAGVSMAEVNLRFIWDVVSQIRVADRGQVYVVDGQGRLIAHSDISLVLSNSDFSHLAQVRTALAASSGSQSSQEPFDGIHGERVLAAHAVITPLSWFVFVELPVAEAYAPIYASILRAGSLLAVALGLAGLAGFMLARRLVVPIEALQMTAARIGRGDLDQRIFIGTGDELEALGEQFNSMAEQLERSYATLERKVQERTHGLSWPTWRSPASWRLRAMICASRCMPWACSLRSCARALIRPSARGLWSGSMRPLPR